MNALSEQRLRDYREHGFLFPLRALTPQQAGACFADFERLERRLGSPSSRPEMRMWRSSTHVCLPWVDALIRNPVILDVAEDILGEDILHHTLCPHRSAPNKAPHRRVGLGISYIPAHVRCTGRTRLYATLVRGTDRWGNFDLLPSPKEEMFEETLALHKRVHARYQENYIEQERRHEAEFGALPASLTMPQ